MYKQRTVCLERTALAVVFCAMFPLLAPGNAGLGEAQAASSLSQIKKIYVGSLGDKNGSAKIHDALVKRLRDVHGLEVVSSQAEADAVITGNAELWVKGYYTTSPRPSRYSQNVIYGGVLSVEVKGKDNETEWSYLVTPSKFYWGTVAEDLADHLVKKFQQALQDSAAKGPSR
jgi:hypothetical protein